MIYMNSSATETVSLQPSGLKARQQRIEVVIKFALAIIAASGVLITTGVVLALVRPSIDFFQLVGFNEFFMSTDWFPLYEPPDYGVWPLVIGTFTVMLIAVIIAVPGGLAVAVFLSEYASPKVKRFLKPLLEILAGVPTVVFGFFALNFIAPNVARKIWVFSDVGFYSALAAGITVGLMILPMMTTLAEDAMAAVPRALVDGAYALGATKREACTGVILQAGLSGIIAAGVIAMSRAIGETTIVLLAAGNTANFSFDPGVPMQTMSSFIGFAGLGDQPTGSTGYMTIFAVGSMLFVITFGLNIFSRRIVTRFREVYE
jgi:phosphate transport system permease protein